MKTNDPGRLFTQARNGDRASLARILSLIERGSREGEELSRLSFAASSNSFTVGITGAPGSGKSTLTSALVEQIRQGGEEVAVLAIDPSSPFSGGAILGDRVRMQDHALDPGVYIRSMATRGHLGGLSVAVPEASRALGAVGFTNVIIETVGVGQVEVEIAEEADTTVVVVNPGWGDAVQANKAGLMEIADIFVINKADRGGVRETRRDLEMMLDMTNLGSYRPPIIETIAQEKKGVKEVLAAMRRHHEFAITSGVAATRRKARLEKELNRILQAAIAKQVMDRLASDEFIKERAEMANGSIDPRSLARLVLGEVGIVSPLWPS